MRNLTGEPTFDGHPIPTNKEKGDVEMKRFKSNLWSIEIPEDWECDEIKEGEPFNVFELGICESSITFSPPSKRFIFQLEAQRFFGHQIRDKDYIDALMMDPQEEISLEPVSFGDFAGYAHKDSRSASFRRDWALSCQDTVLRIRNIYPQDHHGEDELLLETTLRSLRREEIPLIPEEQH